MTRAPMVEKLAAAPGEYDAAPTYLVQQYEQNSTAISREIINKMEADLTSKIRGNTLKDQAAIALEMGAPIGYNVVRGFGLIKSLVLLANPVTAVLVIPALFFTGKQTTRDLRRAFSVDPKVRKHVEQASALSETGNFRAAEKHLKDALEIEIDPTYRRNGDLYLQLGMIQVQDKRPREAMVSLAKASVLFGESEAFHFESDGRKGKISKRGMAELLACAAIDSFARDREGLEEWNAIVGDFARSAEKRFENFASKCDSGHIFGLFGVDEDSAILGRELSAKVRFLNAKMQLKTSGIADEDRIDELIDAAIDDLKNATLDSQEQFAAVFEQAQFYCNLVMSSEDSINAQSVGRAIRLLSQAAELIETDDPKMAAKVRAETASFAMQMIPKVVQTGKSTESLRNQTNLLLTGLSTALTKTSRDEDFALVTAGWVEEQRYRLADTSELRMSAAQNAHDAYLAAGEPVSAMHNSLRIAYCADTEDERNAALHQIMEAARAILNEPTDPVSKAFAAKYFIDAAKAANASPESWTYEQSAEQFLAAAQHVREKRPFVAFFLHGRPIIHSWQVAEVILKGQAASELARAQKSGAALSLYEDVRLRSQDLVSPQAELAIDLERAKVLIELNDLERAKSILDTVLRESRRDQLRNIQHYTLELLNEIQTRQDEALLNPDAEAAKEISDHPAPEGVLGEFIQKRDTLLAICERIIEIADRAGSLDKKIGTIDQKTRLEERLTRVRTGRFRIGIVGEFSAGKSTFLNALLGANVLPSAIRPTTATVIRLTYAEQPEVTVTFSNRSTENIAFENLSNFVTERKNPANERNVAEVAIRYPLPLLKNGIELIDTPGVSSLFQAHTDITLDLIPKCDAVLLLATGRQPFSESIGNFLETVRIAVDGKIFYVINKMDQLDADRAPDAIEFARTEIAKTGIQDAKILPLSAYRALTARLLASGERTIEDLEDDPRLGEIFEEKALLQASHILELEHSLSKFLEDQRGIPLLRDLGGEFLRTTGEVGRNLDTELHTAEMHQQDRRQNFEHLTREHAQKRKFIEERLHGLESDLHEAVLEITSKPALEIPQFTDPILQAINVQLSDVQNEDSVKQFEHRVAQITRQHIENYIERLSADLSKALAWYQNESRRNLRRFQEELQTEFRTTLNLPEPNVDSRLNFAQQQFGEFQTGTDWASALFETAIFGAIGGILGLLGSVLLGPVGIGLAVLSGWFGGNWFDENRAEKRLNKLNEKVSEAVQKSLTQISHDISKRFETSAKEITTQGIASIQDISEQIHNEFQHQLDILIADHDNTEEERREHLQTLRQSKSQLETLRNQLITHIS